MQKPSSLPYSLFILCAVGGYLGYLVYTHDVACVTPITYSLSSYDERFGLSEATIKKDIARAAEVWNDALGKKIFVEVNTAPSLPITFVYEDLQKSIDSIETLNEQIDAAKKKLEKLQSSSADMWESLKTETQKAMDRLKASYRKVASSLK